MGYALSGVCYHDDAELLRTFQGTFPRLEQDAQVTLTASSFGGGALSYTVERTAFSGDNHVYSSTVQLQTCEPSALAQYPIQDVLFPLSILFAVFSGFKTGFRP